MLGIDQCCACAMYIPFYAYSGTSPYTATVSAPDQHVFEVIPQNCRGKYTKTLLKHVEVPAETCVLPFSIN